MNAVLSIYIIVLSVIAMVGCVWLLRWTARRRPGDPKPEDTSHTWDEDLTEYNKPMPRWWVVSFYLTLLFGVGYLIYYPGLGAWRGTSGWTSAGEHDAEQALAEKRRSKTWRATKTRCDMADRSSPTTARPATVRTRAVPRVSRTSPTTSGIGAAARSRSSRPSPAAGRP
jgi:hypothetical protein